MATYYRGADVPTTLQTLAEGHPVLITEFYNNGSVLLKELQRYLNKNVGTIENSRISVRKKLSLDRDVNLQHYLINR